MPHGKSSWFRRLGQTLLVALCTTACTQELDPLAKLANQLYPPVDPAARQLAAAESARAQLEALSSALLYAAVSPRDLQAHLPNHISSQAASATNITVSLGDQELIVRAGYQIEIAAEQLKADGEAEVHCAVSIENSVLVLRPAASRMSVGHVDYHGSKTAQALLPALNGALKAFLNNINGAIADQRIPLHANLLQSVDPAALLQGLGMVSSVSGRTIELNVALGRSAVFIDPQGIHVLADAVVLSQPRILRVLAELKSLAARPAGALFSSEQLALLSECGTHPVPEDEEMKTFQAACAVLLPRLAAATAAAPAAADPATAHAALPDAIRRLHQLFLDKTGLIDNQQNLPWDKTVLALSRAALAADLNEVLSQAQAAVSLQLPNFGGDLRQTILTDPAPDLKCTENAGGCDSDFTYPPYSPRGCDSDCTTNNCTNVLGARICVPGLDLACQGRKTDCERLKEQERLQYEAAKANAKAQWDLRKASCELLKSVRKAGCQINQGWLQGVGGKDVGEVQAHWGEDDGEIDLTVTGVQVGSNLDSLTIQGSLAASALLGADFTFVPHNLGTLVCIAKWSGRVHAKARVAPRGFEIKANLASASNAPDKVTLTFDVTALPIQLLVDPPPVVALVSQNPQIALACPVPSLVAATIADQAAGGFNPVAIGASLKLGQEALKQTIDVNLPARQLTLVVPSRTFTIGKDPITLVPSWTARSVVISH